MKHHVGVGAAMLYVAVVPIVRYAVLVFVLLALKNVAANTTTNSTANTTTNSTANKATSSTINPCDDGSHGCDKSVGGVCVKNARLVFLRNHASSDGGRARHSAMLRSGRVLLRVCCWVALAGAGLAQEGSTQDATPTPVAQQPPKGKQLPTRGGGKFLEERQSRILGAPKR